MIGDVQNIHDIHPLILFLRKRKTATLAACIASSAETTLASKQPERRVPELVRLGTELGLIHQKASQLTLSDSGRAYACVLVGRTEINPTQAEILRRNLLAAPEGNPTLRALVVLLHLIPPRQSVQQTDLSEGFTAAIGKGRTWTVAVTRTDNTRMGLNFLAAMGLLRKIGRSFVLTDIGEAALARLPALKLPTPGPDTAPAPPPRYRITPKHQAREFEQMLNRLRKQARKGTERRILATARRGQALLKLSLLHLYRGRCALCEISEPILLRASHIVPWSDANATERLSPENAILLCTLHDSLFDKGFIGLTADLQVVVSPALNLRRSPALRPHVTNLVFRPPLKHRPAACYLAIHRKKHGLDNG